MIKNELYTDCVDCWFDFYREQYAEEYEFSAIHGNHLKKLLNKIKRKHKQKGLPEDNQALLNSFSAFITTVHRQADQWLQNNFEIPIINSKFNSLYVQAKQRNSEKDAARLYQKFGGTIKD